MKKNLLILALFFSVTLHAQEKFKFGTVSKELVERKSYEQFPDAEAVVVHEEADVRYDFMNGMFKMIRENVIMLKILTQDGADKATFEIITHNLAVSGTAENIDERISNLDGEVFNLVDGKIQKTKLDRKYVVYEQIDPNTRRAKITLPGVIAGSVVQLKHTINSDLFFHIPEWRVQREIPVLYSSIVLSLPDFFKFNVRSKGYERLSVNEKKGSSYSSLPGTGGTREISIVGKNIPPIKDDKFLFCVGDFSTAVNFELAAIDIPSMPIQNYSTTWASIEKNLLESSYFGKWLKFKNPFPTEVAKIVSSTTNKSEQIALIYDLLKSKMTWDNSFRLHADDLKEALKKGSGSNAQFNFILMSMLRDAGFEVKPVLVSPRSMGRFPIGSPSMEKVNSFVVAINADDKAIYIDGSSTLLGDYNLLPYILHADQAWFMGTGLSEPGFMGTLNKMGLSSINCKLNVTFVGSDYSMKVTEQMTASGQDALKLKQRAVEYENQEEYKKDLEKKNGITIDSLSLSGLDRPGHGIERVVIFSCDPRVEEDRIYFNPLIFKHISENPFTEEERKLPVEFEYPYFFKAHITVTLPDGYEIDDLPEGTILSTKSQNMKLLFSIIEIDEKTIQITYNFMLNETMISYTSYPELKSLWENAVKLNNQYIVLKKRANS